MSDYPGVWSNPKTSQGDDIANADRTRTRNRIRISRSPSRAGTQANSIWFTTWRRTEIAGDVDDAKTLTSRRQGVGLSKDYKEMGGPIYIRKYRWRNSNNPNTERETHIQICMCETMYER